jgi:hypothetical protein
VECPHCTAELPAGARFCPVCGKAVPPLASPHASGGDGDIVAVRSTVIKTGNVFLGEDAVAAQMGAGECPICGSYNRRFETFRCQGCDREYLCLGHQDPELMVCPDCASALREVEEQNRADERRAIWLKRAVVAAGLVALVYYATTLVPDDPTPTPPPSANKTAISAQSLTVTPSRPGSISTVLPTATPVWPVPAAKVMYVSAGGDGVYVRSSPDLEARVTAWPDGTQMDALGVKSGWYYVRTPDGYLGFVPALYLAVATPVAPTRAP